MVSQMKCQEIQTSVHEAFTNCRGWMEVMYYLHVGSNEAWRHRIERRRPGLPETGVNGCRTGLA